MSNQNVKYFLSYTDHGKQVNFVKKQLNTSNSLSFRNNINCHFCDYKFYYNADFFKK